MANSESWKDVFRNRQIDQAAEIQSWSTPVNQSNTDRILADAARLKEDPNALTPEKTLELLAYMNRNNMPEYDDLVKTLRPSRGKRFKAGSQGFLDNWLALGLVDDRTYATNPHTERDKAIGQALGSAALFAVGHPLAWLMGRAGIGMKLAKAKKATKVAKVATSPATSRGIAKAAAAIGRTANVASGVSAVGKSVKPVAGLASGKYIEPWNEIIIRDATNAITDPFGYPGQFKNQ